MRRAGGCFLLLAALATAPARAQGGSGLLFQGLVDGEGWSTDTLSNLLTRNRGRAAPLGRVQTWIAVEPWRRIVAYAQAEATFGSARSTVTPSGVQLEQVGLRYTPSSVLMFDAGKMTNIVGGFAPRRFSNRNPLIGAPDAYPVQYPVGFKVSGAAKVVDYRAAIVSLPMSHRGYVPEPSPAPRPAVGFGVTPFVGFRIGASGTWGAYLNRNLTPTQLNNRNWRDYQQRIAAADVTFSRGYLETYAEFAASTYDVPRRADRISGTAYFIEAKYTLTPRFFVAGRYERNDYPFITAAGPTAWVSRNTEFSNGEVGAGFRLTAMTLLKASFRVDDWVVTPQNQAFIRPGGRAVAVQVSQGFDVMDWVERWRAR